MVHHRGRRRSSGITLLEALMAGTMGLVVLLGAYSLFSYFSRAAGGMHSSAAVDAEQSELIGSFRSHFQKRLLSRIAKGEPAAFESIDSTVFGQTGANPCKTIKVRSRNTKTSPESIETTVYKTICTPGALPSGAPKVHPDLSCPGSAAQVVVSRYRWPDESKKIIPDKVFPVHPTGLSTAACFRLYADEIKLEVGTLFGTGRPQLLQNGVSLRVESGKIELLPY